MTTVAKNKKKAATDAGVLTGTQTAARTLKIAATDTDGEYLGTWTKAKGLTKVDSWEITWSYKNTRAQWIEDSSESLDAGDTKQSVYSPPGNAVAIKFSVNATAKEVTYSYKNAKGKTVSVTTIAWTSKANTKTKSIGYPEPDTPEIGSVVYNSNSATDYNDGYVTITLSEAVTNSTTTTGTTKWQLFRYCNGKWTQVPDSNTANRETVAKGLSASKLTVRDTDVILGETVVYAARAYTTWSSPSHTAYSDYSDYYPSTDDPILSEPVPVYITSVTSLATNSLTVEWEAASTDYTNPSFEIWYSSRFSDMALDDIADAEGDVAGSVEPGAGLTSYTFSVESAATLYLKIRATNDSGSSVWCRYDSAVSIGTTPSAPTCSSTPTYASVGDTITLTWIHNCEDACTQTGYELQLAYGEAADDAPAGLDYTDIASSDSSTLSTYDYATDAETADTYLFFRVRTCGANGEYGEYGYFTCVTMVAPVSLTVTTDAETITALPLVLYLRSNIDIRLWQIVVQNDDSMIVVDSDGDDTYLSAGTTVFEGTVQVGDDGYDATEIEAELDATTCAFFGGATYTATLSAVSIYGTQGTDSCQFEIDWDDSAPVPQLTIAGVDNDELVAHLFPACYASDDDDDDDTEDAEYLRDDVTLAIYRLDTASGDAILIADDIENTGTAEVLDYYPNFGTCTYRVRATTDTGIMGFWDVETVVDCEDIVIQYTETHHAYTDADADGYALSEIRIPYNIAVTEAYDPDVEYVDYIGNTESTFYAGTQRGATAKSSGVLITIDDADTIGALRRYANSLTTCYYRDPTGLGFWAHIVVQLDQTYQSPLTSVTLEVTKIDGDYTGLVYPEGEVD